MTQYTIPTIDPTATSGTQLATLLNDLQIALNTTQKGDTAPSFAKTGIVWAGKNGRVCLRASDGEDYTFGTRPVTSVADLRAFGEGQGPDEVIFIQVGVVVTFYMWDEDSSAADDGDDTIKATETVGYGRWLKRGAGGISSLVEDLTPQLGGFLEPNGNYIGMEKGGDIASASPLVIDTDGDYFDVTGTTNFAVMTVAENRHFFLKFTGILTVTHGAGITIEGAADFTTTAGDIFECVSTAENVVNVVNITKVDGKAVVSSSGSGYISVETKTADYTIVAGDAGKLLKMNGNYDFDLTAVATLGETFAVTVMNISAAPIVVDIDPNGAEKIVIGFLDRDTLGMLAGEIGTLYNDGTKFYFQSHNFAEVAPHFSATYSSYESNATGDGTAVAYICNTEDFDNGTVYNSGTGVVTSPINAVWEQTTGVDVGAVPSGSRDNRRKLDLVSSNETFFKNEGCNDGYLGGSEYETTPTYSREFVMDASDTCYPQVTVYSGAKDIKVGNAATSTFFEGRMIRRI